MSDAPRPHLALIVAADRDGVIGRDGELPWHLPDDLRRFRRLTTGHTVLMGRRTYESIGRPLPKRRNLVLSHRAGYAPAGVEVFPSFEAACTAADAADTLFVLGGSSVFAAALPHADTLHLTRVDASVPGDVHLPLIDWSQWTLAAEEHHPADERHAHPFVFQDFRRMSP
ncbi:MAG: dihydrofolate reductase [Acidobacteriota bacterium]